MEIEKSEINQDFSFNSVFMSFLRALDFGSMRGVENYCRD